MTAYLGLKLKWTHSKSLLAEIFLSRYGHLEASVRNSDFQPPMTVCDNTLFPCTEMGYATLDEGREGSG